MRDQFSKTVNLRRDNRDENNATANERRMVQEAKDPLDEMYGSEAAQGARGLKSIQRPATSGAYKAYLKYALGLSALALIVIVAFWQLKRDRAGGNADKAVNDQRWYSVKLVDGEVFYGQTADITANPLTISKVYYDYDQQTDDKTADGNNAQNLRLVKRGREMHGPTGEMNIYQSQIIYLEPLKEDSKVLNAILEHEKD